MHYTPLYSRTIRTNNPRYGIAFDTFEGNSEVFTIYAVNTVTSNYCEEIYQFCLVVRTLYDKQIQNFHCKCSKIKISLNIARLVLNLFWFKRTSRKLLT